MTPDFIDVVKLAYPHTIVSFEKCHRLHTLTCDAQDLPGDIAECGVYRGGTALLLAATTTSKHLHLFDSFCGLPAPCAKDNHHKEGDFADANPWDVRRLLAPYIENITIHPGWMPGTFSEVEKETFALVHVDVDLYETALACCEFFYPRLCAGGVLVFDDYEYPDCMGVTAAVREYFGDRAQAVIFKD